MKAKLEPENISALIDGELDTEQHSQLLDGLMGDAYSARQWEHYQLIGAVMRNEGGPFSERLIKIDLVDRVHTQLTNEPTVLAPSSAPLRREVRQNKPEGRSRMAAGALALAASVAALAVITFKPQDPSLEVLPVAVLETPAAPVSAGMEEDLMGLLVEHGEFSGASGLNGLVAYAKFVSNNSVVH